MNLRVVKVNPNDNSGGGGCLCHELKHEDASGPYVIFPENEMENPMSPHAVLCAPCAAKALELIEDESEHLAGGEVNPNAG